MDVKRVAELSAFRAEKMAKVSVFQTPRMFYDLYCLEPGQAQKVHAHAGSDKVYLVMEGRAIVTIGEEERVLGVGECVIAEAGIVHGVRAEERAVCLVVTSPPPSKD